MFRIRRPTEGYCPDAGHFIPNGVPDRIEQDWRLFPHDRHEILILIANFAGLAPRRTPLTARSVYGIIDVQAPRSAPPSQVDICLLGPGRLR
jgi:hypothetical protein